MITGQDFEVNRRVYVDFEGISLRRKFLTGLEPELVNVMIGNAIIIILAFLLIINCSIFNSYLVSTSLLSRFLPDRKARCFD